MEYRTEGARTEFVRGNNYISLCPAVSTPRYESAIDHLKDWTDVALKVGVGTGPTARKVAMGAKTALENCHEADDRVSRQASAEPLSQHRSEK